jgi:hypothetical protein
LNAAKIGIISGTCKEISRNLTIKFHFSWKFPIFAGMKWFRKLIEDLGPGYAALYLCYIAGHVLMGGILGATVTYIVIRSIGRS